MTSVFVNGPASWNTTVGLDTDRAARQPPARRRAELGLAPSSPPAGGGANLARDTQEALLSADVAALDLAQHGLPFFPRATPRQVRDLAAKVQVRRTA